MKKRLFLLLCIVLWLFCIGCGKADPSPLLDTETETAYRTESETVQTAGTESDTVYVTPADDTAYFPAHTVTGDEPFPTVTKNAAEARIYACLPETDSAAFNTACADYMDSLFARFSGDETARAGGTVVLTVDYRFYRAEGVYSCLFVIDRLDTVTGTAEKSLSLFSYDTAAESVAVPLDRYYPDTTFTDLLSTLLYIGYRDACETEKIPCSDAYLESISSVNLEAAVNVCADGDCLCFFSLSEDGTTVLCAEIDNDLLLPCLYENVLAAQKQMGTERIREGETDELYDFEAVIAATDPVSDAYFSDALFIGNSLVVGLAQYADFSSQYLACNGMSVAGFFTEACIERADGTLCTMSEALADYSFSKVYLMFGTNELWYPSTRYFFLQYEKILARIQEVNPDAVIYIHSVPPVNPDKITGAYASVLTNARVNLYNAALPEFCAEHGVFYLNLASILRDESGKLPEDASGDGIHLYGAYILKWTAYLRTHAALQEIQ